MRPAILAAFALGLSLTPQLSYASAPTIADGGVQEDWAKRLENADAAAARSELLALKAKAVEPLLAVMNSGSDAAAFQAALVFSALGKDGKQGFEPLLALAASEEQSEARRAFAVLALGGAESGAKKIAPQLTPLLLDHVRSELALAASLTLAALGKDAAKPLVSALADAPAPVALRACSSLVNLGAAAAGSIKDLAALVEDRANGARGFAAGVALQAIGPKAEKSATSAWRKRGHQSAGPPIPLPNPCTAEHLIQWMRHEVSLRQMELAAYGAADIAMPADVDDIDHDTYKTMIELHVCWSRHLGEEQGRLALDLAQSKVVDSKDWVQRVTPLTNADRWMVALLGP